jgi:hypothetical protein
MIGTHKCGEARKTLKPPKNGRSASNFTLPLAVICAC